MVKRNPEVLNESGFSCLWLNPSGVDQAEIIGAIRQRLYEQYLQDWNRSLMASSKLRLFKNTLEYEPYLNQQPYLSASKDQCTWIES